MALPKTNATPREQYLQDIVGHTRSRTYAMAAAHQRRLRAIGEFIEQYSFIDFNLRRFIEVLDPPMCFQ